MHPARHPLNVVLILALSAGHARADEPAELALDYQAFDQTPGRGWRTLAAAGKHLDGARLIDRYASKKEGLEPWQRINLRFHAGQMYAYAGRTDDALARFKGALHDQEPADSPIRWNAYVRATIAFLEKDRERLLTNHEEIARGPMFMGTIPNLDVVDRLIAHFDAPYAVAYGARSKPDR
jgi:hypothetical protein